MSNQPLQKNGIGLLGATTLGVVMLSPAMTLYGGFGPAYIGAGAAAPLAFVWALLATLPTACSYIVLSKDYPTSGSAADWADRAFSRKISVWTGWMVFLYYLTNFVIQPVTLGVFTGDLMKVANINPGFWTFALGALACLAWGATFVYRGISISSKSALVLLLIETGVVTALCLTVVQVARTNGAHLSLDGFHVRASPTGASGIFKAMVFAILAFCGFDVVSTLAEETKDAEKTIPRATILALVVYAGIIILGIWSLTYGGSREEIKAIGDAGQMPISAIAQKVWGRSGLLIPITGITATLGLAIATAIGASRVLFSMGRAGLAPKAFAVLGLQKTPKNALHAIFILGFIGSLVTAIFLGPFEAYQWWGTTSTFFAMITYFMVNGSNLILNRKRVKNGLGSLLVFALIPEFGLVVDLYLLYRTFFVELWAGDWATSKSVVVFDVICCLIGVAAACWPKREISSRGSDS
jgi:amino acid transporter